MKLLLTVFFAFGCFFSFSQQESYRNRGQGSYTEEESNRVKNSIHVQSSAVSHEDLRGTWAYSGSGCRAPSLDPESHQSQALDLSTLIGSMILIFNSRGGAKIRGVFLKEDVLLREGREEQMSYEEEGSYTLYENRIDFENSEEGFFNDFQQNYFINDHLVVVDLSRDGLQACGLNHISVLIFRKVN